MNRTLFKITSLGSFVITLGGGWMVWRKVAVPPQNPLSSESLNVALVPAQRISPVLESPASVGGAAFEVQVVLDQLRATFERDRKAWYPMLKTWVLLGTLSQPQVEELLQSALAGIEPEEKKALVGVLFQYLAKVNPDAALAWVDRLPPEATGQTVAAMLSFWGTRDLAAARQWYALSVAERAAEFPETVKVFEKFAKLQPVTPAGPAGIAAAMAAYHEARTKAEPGHWSSSEAEPVVAWARQTGQWASAVTAAGDESSLRSYLHRNWAGENPAAWLAWMRDHPQEGGRDGEGGKGFQMKRNDILVQAIDAVTSYQSGPSQAYAVGSHLDDLLGLLRDAGADFSSEHGNVRVVLEHAFPRWLERQPTQASEWVKRHQKEPWIEPVIAVLATSVAKHDPVAAMAWAGQIKDAARRQKTYIDAHAAWRVHDPAAADAWAADHLVELGK
jgi:hypothetical protein